MIGAESFVIDVGSDPAAPVPPLTVKATARPRVSRQQWLEKYLGNVEARYDGAATSPENEAYWSAADFLSPRASNSRRVRKLIRSRSRYEAHESNCYAYGMARVKTNDVIGTGARLQFTSRNPDWNKFAEIQFGKWARATRFNEKCRTLNLAKDIDGEGFAEKIHNPQLRTPVQIDLRLSEADHWTNPEWTGSEPQEDDGIKYDRSGNPTFYRRLRNHPGDVDIVNSDPWAYDDLPASDVIHFFRADRPGQRRGISTFAPALSLFSQLRRWIHATLAAAETAAHFGGVMYSDASWFSDNPDDPQGFSRVELERKALLTLPAGWKLEQLKSEHPNAQFEAVEEKILMQMARCLIMPLNVASGSSRRHNFASGKLDYLLYYNACDIDRLDAEIGVYDRGLEWWLDEALMIPGYLDWAGLGAHEITHRWQHPPRRPIDELKDAQAKAIRWKSGHYMYRDYCTEENLDVEEI